MNCLFWNVNLGKGIDFGEDRKEVEVGCSKLNDFIVKIVMENKINVLALAEFSTLKEDLDDLKRKFIDKKYDIYELSNLGSRITVFTTYPTSSIERLKDKRHYTLFRLWTPSIGKIMFGFVHLFSKSMKDENDYISKVSKLVAEIEKNEEKNKSDFTIIAGDFNMNPFEKGMLQGGAFHAFPTINEAKKISHILDDEEYKMFYNPMWKYFDKNNGVLGTYFTRPTHSYGLYYNIFDQVIYRPSLIEHIESVDIKTKIGVKNLVDLNKILISDHLPLFYKVKEII